MKLFSTFLLLALTITACAPSVYDQSLNQQENLTWREYNYPKDQVFKVVLSRLQLGESTLLMADPDLGIITTDWQEETSLRQQIITGGQRSRINYNIIPSSKYPDRTVVKINMSVQQRLEGTDNWQEQPVTKKTARNIIRPLLEAIDIDLRN